MEVDGAILVRGRLTASSEGATAAASEAWRKLPTGLLVAAVTLIAFYVTSILLWREFEDAPRPYAIRERNAVSWERLLMPIWDVL